MAEELPGIIRKSTRFLFSRSLQDVTAKHYTKALSADKEWLRSTHDVSGTTATVMLFEGGEGPMKTEVLDWYV